MQLFLNKLSFLFFTIGLILMACAPSEPITTDSQFRGLERISFNINYLYRAGGSGEFKQFRDGSILHSGDHYKLIFEPSRDGYVYIFQIDSGNKIVRLFPTDEFSGAAAENSNPVVKGNSYFVPAEHKSFKLDQQIGKETIYLVVTQSRDAKLEAFYQKIKLAQEIDGVKKRQTTRQKWHNAMMKLRGAELELVDDENTQITWNEQGEEFSVISQYLKNMCVGCVHIVNFEHRSLK